ncbi:MAG: GatB/YqeY domain-containing protein [Candidatus Saganbacteria bacterium]|nr:GatB/YqeY domain-containing protein [Candidatus Saganbacteria bacterium]
MFKKLNDDLQKSMKEKNAERLSVLRMVKSKILLVNARGELPDEEIIKIISKYGKSLKEAIEEAIKVGRNEAAEETAKELLIVEEYLPKALSEEELKTLIKQVIADTGAASAKDMGKVMKEVLQKAPGIDGKVVNAMVKKFLS